MTEITLDHAQKLVRQAEQTIAMLLHDLHKQVGPITNLQLSTLNRMGLPPMYVVTLEVPL